VSHLEVELPGEKSKIVDNEKKPVKGKRLNGRTMDISGSGAKIKTHTLLPVYTLIVLKSE